MGLLNPGDKPLIWRGPMLHSVMQQFLRNVQWGELDYLVVDLPPGTGDVQLSLIQSTAVTGAVLVTTPSIVALADVRKAIEMFRQVNVEILGVVENMSYFNCPHCNGRIDVFGHGEGERMAKAFGVPFLGEVEIDPQIRIGGDTGKPVVSLGEDAPGAASLFAVARNVARQDVYKRQRSCCLALSTWCGMPDFFKSSAIFSDFSMEMLPTSTGWPLS